MSKEVFEKIDKLLKDNIRKGLKDDGINASGNLSKSLRSEISEQLYILYAANYAQFADIGRGKTRQRTGNAFQAIYDWLQYKKYGLTWSNNKERTSLAIAIMRKHAKDGSYKFRNPTKQTKVFESAVINASKIIKEQFIIFERQSQLKQIKKVINGN